MSYNVGALDTLVEQFERIPGIGHKSAQRMAFYVLNMPEEVRGLHPRRPEKDPPL